MEFNNSFYVIITPKDIRTDKREPKLAEIDDCLMIGSRFTDDMLKLNIIYKHEGKNVVNNNVTVEKIGEMLVVGGETLNDKISNCIEMADSDKETFYIGISIYFASFYFIIYMKDVELEHNPFEPMNILLPVSDLSIVLCETWYNRLRYYVEMIKTYDEKINPIGRIMLINMEDFWNKFGEFTINDTSELDISSDMTSIYGAILCGLSLLKTSSLRGNTPQGDEVRCLEDMEKQSIKNLDRTYEIEKEMKKRYEEIKSKFDGLSSNIKELNGSTEKAKSSIIKEVSKRAQQGIDERLNVEIARIRLPMEEIFKKIELEHEYKIISSVNDVLDKKAAMMLEMENSCSKNLNDILDKTVEYKKQLDDYGKIKMGELNTSIRRSLEKDGKVIISKLFENASIDMGNNETIKELKGKVNKLEDIIETLSKKIVELEAKMSVPADI